MEVDTTLKSDEGVLVGRRRRNAMANIFEHVKSEEVLLLNLDFEINMERRKQIARDPNEQDYVKAFENLSKIPSQPFKSRSRGTCIASDLTNHLTELTQDKKKILKTG